MRSTWIFRGARIAAASLFVLAVIAESVARAEAAPAKASDVETLAAARAVAIEGVKLARAGYCPQAIEHLERAEALHHSSIVLAELGECYLRGGRVVAASEALRSVTREPLPEAPSPAQRAAHQRAERLLSDALARTAQLTIEIRGPTLSEVSLMVDDHVVSSALIGIARPSDPGLHRVTVSAPDFVSDSAEVMLAAGEAQVLTLNMQAQPRAAQPSADGPRAEPTPAPATRAPSTPETRTRRTGFALLGVGAAGLALSAGFGAAALHLKRELDAECSGDSCPATARDELDEAKRWGLASTLSFALGGASAVVGTILLVLQKREQPKSPSRPSWSVSSGPGIGLGTQARF